MGFDSLTGYFVVRRVMVLRGFIIRIRKIKQLNIKN